ncbi:putative major facilitator superfamily, general substrate transporter [Candidatus Terasakiella magnetica]|nr:putative major facilitator superfamily, general substrate transporter [Candidatus Terasakiella magnetica]
MSSLRLLVGGLLSCAVALGLGRFAFTPILPVMQAEFGFDAQGSGWLAASNNVGYLIGAFTAGWVTSDAGRHRILTLGFIALLVSLALMPLTGSMLVWNVLRLLAGIASGWIFVLASALILPLLAQAGHARWSGLHFGGVGLGIIMAGLVVGKIAAGYGSNAAWVVTAAMAALFTAIAWPVLKAAHPHQPSASAPPPKPMDYPMTLLACAYFCEGLGYIVTGTFLVAVVKATPGLEDVANLSWVLVGMAALPSAAGWSWLSERKGPLATLIIAHTVQAVGVALPAFSSHPAVVLLGAVMYGGTFLGIVGVALAMGRAITPGNPARTMGWLTGVFGVGQIIGPVLAAWIAAKGGWGPALLMAAGFVAFGGMLLSLPLFSSRRCGVPRPGSDG